MNGGIIGDAMNRVSYTMNNEINRDVFCVYKENEYDHRIIWEDHRP